MQREQQLPRIVIPDSEHERLSALVETISRSSPVVYEYLSRELERAQLVPEQKMARSVVRMGSRVTYRDNANGRLRTVTLTYPHEADITSSRISILTPIGAALLGMSLGQTIRWPSPSGEAGSLTVLDVENSDNRDGAH